MRRAVIDLPLVSSSVALAHGMPVRSPLGDFQPSQTNEPLLLLIWLANHHHNRPSYKPGTGLAY
jgi:hypothetical protein